MPAFRNQTEIGKQLASVADHFVECCIKREDVAENGGDDQCEWNRTDNEVESDSRCIQKYIFSDNQTDGLFDKQFERVLSVLRSEEHTSEIQSRGHLVCRLLLEK